MTELDELNHARITIHEKRKHQRDWNGINEERERKEKKHVKRKKNEIIAVYMNVLHLFEG